MAIALLVALVALVAGAAVPAEAQILGRYDPRLIERYLSAGDAGFQIHTHYTGVDTERVFSYVTNYTSGGKAPPTKIAYGLSKDKLTETATGTSYKFGTDDHYFYVHNVYVHGLTEDATYYYQVGEDTGGLSDVHSTTIKSKAITYAVYGDFGFDNDVSLSQLVSEVNAGAYDAVIHVGDFAYDLNSNAGKVGDAFMAAIQPIASAVPYMVAPGNHESYSNFTHYVNRFSGVTIGAGALSQSGTNLWYSFNKNNVHWVVIDTEVYAYSVNQGEIDRQLKWLEADLIEANANRQQVPWILMFGHKFEYMDSTNWTSFWPLAHQYGVDLYMCGHQHNYQRNWPYYQDSIDTQQQLNVYTNPKYMVAIVAGSPGCQEDISTDMNTADKLAYSSLNYGYGHLMVYNATHLFWQWQKTGNGSGSQTTYDDYLWIVQNHHGPRQ